MVVVPDGVTPTIPLETDVQEKKAPGVVLVMFTKVDVCPEQIVWLGAENAIATVGFTTTFTVSVLPGQPLAVGVI